MFSEELFDVVDEGERSLFDDLSQSVWVVEVEFYSQVVFKNRVTTFRRRDNTVLRSLAVFKQLPVLPLNLPVTCREPGFKSKCILVKDNRNLQVAILKRRREQREVCHVHVSLIENGYR